MNSNDIIYIVYCINYRIYNIIYTTQLSYNTTKIGATKIDIKIFCAKFQANYINLFGENQMKYNAHTRTRKKNKKYFGLNQLFPALTKFTRIFQRWEILESNSNLHKNSTKLCAKQRKFLRFIQTYKGFLVILHIVHNDEKISKFKILIFHFCKNFPDGNSFIKPQLIKVKIL